MIVPKIIPRPKNSGVARILKNTICKIRLTSADQLKINFAIKIIKALFSKDIRERASAICDNGPQELERVKKYSSILS